ncbi:MAG TPA: hypothetical protein PKL77_10045 [Candidatus Omnitrophota bacterium]|nr:hypothetical protein [Candidatus Omnitrophota bacterium]HNX82471.1 hypothetical protein [Candidatus Omnitrophota bacterium]HPT06972.1 hypothetical protein [Candidatus Omnitrophota bacterium]
MEYRIDKQGLLDTLSAWDGFLNRKVHLIACGGTAMTLLGVKASTKDIDLIVPNIDEHEYIVKILQQIGYKQAGGWGWSRDDGFVFDLFRGKYIITELLESPLEEDNHFLFKEFSHIYLGILNYYDIIISKIFRSTSVDIEDCLALLKSKRSEIDFKKLDGRFRKTASYDTSEAAVIKNWEYFLSVVEKEAIYG